MNLEDFISETIKGIANGINKANEELNDLDCYVNPPKVVFHGGDGPEVVSAEIAPAEDNPTRLVETIEFDVNVQVSDSTETGGQAGVAISVLKLGTDASSASETQNSSRVSFTVPVVFPVANINNT